ncbi:TonB-dependent copper receptor [Pseudothauera rhizosphaerae]|uniref:TonB-dependent copper receptor n=1 Tax=Pseudothauera rhizosphaerae TaxID=2565932 RepID=A0A4S4AHD4_9RHOO|nr:TonB-dependent copper receptor [Pseudothauera rhizosphaerae]THF58615.1 TonB-dependent copper receptor [Pseudothauera rhizosphaerae]
MQHRQTRLAAALFVLPFALPAAAEEEPTLAPQVVTAAPMSEPLTVVTDPRAARQPIPALDGADILKTVPGFSVIRKGGTSGDPVFRGMAGSRLNILLDGENILGGCGGRMDPPTAYVFPDSYDRMTVLKGPQTVAHGPGNSAGTVLFERDRRRAAEAGGEAHASLTAGSFGRLDLLGDGRYATPDFYVRATATRTRADDYEDGDGNEVHSAYKRWSGTVALGWTPDDDTVLELTYARSDGEAAYADRMMDGSEFDRENVGLRFEKRNLSPVVEKLEAQVYRNYIDHVMDNFTLRDGPAMPGMRMVSNPDRLTRGGRVAADLRLADPTLLTVGVDAQSNDHTARSAMGANAWDAYHDAKRRTDATFRNQGVFAELQHQLGEQDRIVGGLRADRWRAKDHRSGAIVTAGERRSETLESGFARWEHDLAKGAATAYAGLGHVERFPDYWELISQNKQSETTNSAFLTKPEKTTQLDVGVSWEAGAVSGSVSAFYADIDDYILVDKVTKGGGITSVRNVEARSYGLEAGLGWRFAHNWQADATLAWVHGRNRTDDTPLAQQPPLEARLALNWDDGTWSAGALWRLVAAQNRVDEGKGNIAGLDIGKSDGFGVFSINGGYRASKRVQLIAGIDNLFDKRYAEHLSKSGADVPGYETDVRVNEPGRTLWLKASLTLD